MVYGIEILVEEHDNVLKFNEIMRTASLKVMNGEELDPSYFRKALDFGRTYIDKYHHGKEENILFEMMVEKLGALGNQVVKNGMLVEHDLGRLYLLNLEKALDRYEETGDDNSKLDIIVAINEYGELLKRHAEKENDVVYTFAERKFTKEDIDELNLRTEEFEKNAEKENVKNRYIDILDDLKSEA